MFAVRLKELRIEKGLTQKQLAEKLNMQNTAISKYELNERKPDTETLLKIAKYFNVSVDYLLGNTEIKAPEPEDDSSNDKPDPNDLKILFSKIRDLSKDDQHRINAIVEAFKKENQD